MWYDSYLKGAQQLCEETDKDSEAYELLFVLYIRLTENLRETFYGRQSSNKAERMEIISRLNSITEDILHVRFDVYCERLHKKFYQEGKAPFVFQAEDGDPNSGLVETETATNIHATKSRNTEHREHFVARSVLPEETLDFLLSARNYMLTFLPLVQNAKQAFDNAIIPPQGGMDVYKVFQPFSHLCLSFSDTDLVNDAELLKMCIYFSSANQQIKEINPLLQAFCTGVQQPGKRENKFMQDTTQKLIIRLSILQTDVKSLQDFIEALIREKFPPDSQPIHAIS